MIVDGVELGNVYALVNFDEAVDKLGLTFRLNKLNGARGQTKYLGEKRYEITIDESVPIEERMGVVIREVNLIILGAYDPNKSREELDKYVLEMIDDPFEPNWMHIHFEGHREYYEKNPHLPGADLERKIWEAMDRLENKPVKPDKEVSL